MANIFGQVYLHQKEFILAYETSIGTFIANKNGEVISKLGRKNSPLWLNNNWILFMDDKDDGEKLISSDLKIISFDGKNGNSANRNK